MLHIICAADYAARNLAALLLIFLATLLLEIRATMTSRKKCILYVLTYKMHKIRGPQFLALLELEIAALDLGLGAEYSGPLRSGPRISSC